MDFNNASPKGLPPTYIPGDGATSPTPSTQSLYRPPDFLLSPAEFLNALKNTAPEKGAVESAKIALLSGLAPTVPREILTEVAKILPAFPAEVMRSIFKI